MSGLSNIGIFFVVMSAIGAVGFAVYYSFLVKKTPAKIQQYLSYLFVLYWGFPLSIVLGFIMNFYMQRDMEIASRWGEEDLYISIVIVFVILIAITMRMIWNDMNETKRRQEKKIRHRLRKQEFTRNNPNYVQCEYCGAWVEKANYSCPVCRMEIRPYSEPAPNDSPLCDQTPCETQPCESPPPEPKHWE